MTKTSTTQCAPRRALAALCLAFCLATVPGLSACGTTSENPADATSETFSESVNDTAEADKAAEEEAASNDEAESTAKEEAAPTPATAANAVSLDAVQSALEPIVSPYGNAVSVVVLPLANSTGYSVNSDVQFASASTIKLLILAEFMDEVDAGAISLNASYTLQSSDIVGGSGSLQNYGAGATYTYDDIARAMIAQSDNTAANILIRTMGMDAINAKAAELGLSQTVLNRYMMDTTSGLENYTSANDLATILQGIGNETIASAAMCERAQGYLLAQTDSAGLAQGLPAGVTFGHKTGWLDSVRNDCGIVLSGQAPYVIVTLCSTNTGSIVGADGANSLMAQISGAAYSALNS